MFKTPVISQYGIDAGMYFKKNLRSDNVNSQCYFVYENGVLRINVSIIQNCVYKIFVKAQRIKFL